MLFRSTPSWLFVRNAGELADLNAPNKSASKSQRQLVTFRLGSGHTSDGSRISVFVRLGAWLTSLEPVSGSSATKVARNKPRNRPLGQRPVGSEPGSSPWTGGRKLRCRFPRCNITSPRLCHVHGASVLQASPMASSHVPVYMRLFAPLPDTLHRARREIG